MLVKTFKHNSTLPSADISQSSEAIKDHKNQSGTNHSHVFLSANSPPNPNHILQ